jgi:hypothetical protein
MDMEVKKDTKNEKLEQYLDEFNELDKELGKVNKKIEKLENPGKS